MRKATLTLVTILLLSLSRLSWAQTLAPEQFYSNVFGAGASYDNISKPHVSAGFLEAKLLTSPTNNDPIYSFTFFDISPIKTDKGVIWQMAVTTGLAPLSRSLGPLGRLWIAGTIGGGAAGSSSGLAWSAGGAVTKRITESGFIAIVDLRVLRIANSDYQARLGLKFAWGNR